MTRSIGLDLSATSTGIVVIQGALGQKNPTLLHEATVTFKKETGIHRAHLIADEVERVLTKWDPQVAVIEGYGYANANSLATVVEVGTIVRYRLYLLERPYYEPTPTQVKLFATGKGNTKKEHMMMEVLSRWGHQSKNNDTADAYALAAMGLALRGALTPLTAFMIKATQDLRTN